MDTLKFIFWHLLSLSIAISLFYSSFVLARGGGRKEKAALLWCVAFALFMAGANYYMHTTTLGLVDGMGSTARNIKELPAGWGADMAAGERTKNSRTLASSVFVSDGRLISYVAKDGKLIQFSPTQEEVTERDETVVASQMLATMSGRFASSAAGWLLNAIFAIALGFIYGRHVAKS